jgi:hypothetical protein
LEERQKQKWYNFEVWLTKLIYYESKDNPFWKQSIDGRIKKVRENMPLIVAITFCT